MKRHHTEASVLVQRGLGAHGRDRFGPEAVLKYYQIAVLYAAVPEATMEVSWTRTSTRLSLSLVMKPLTLAMSLRGSFMLVS
jgi:hypothetical protein